MNAEPGAGPPFAIPELTSITQLAETADVWFVDIWGVMHNGYKPFDSAVVACQTFRQGGGRVLLLSNSPRPRAGVIRQLDDIGVPRDAYDYVITSGDVSRTLIAGYAGQTIWHVGPDRDVSIFDGTGVQRGGPDAATAIVCTGLFDDEREQPDDYRERFAPLAERSVEMVCANPDISVERGGRIIPCAGALADLYAQLGGAVSLAGKPYQPIYEDAFKWVREVRSGSLDRQRILAIGDGAKTDIAGAAAAGVRSVFVQSRVNVQHGETLSTAAARLFSKPDGRPVAVMASLAW